MVCIKYMAEVKEKFLLIIWEEVIKSFIDLLIIIVYLLIYQEKLFQLKRILIGVHLFFC
ncbi:UNVERIFIED_CONTAM: hypothetical protein GTU68_036244 [Idotea baltica]|nr:hypothetical protein [Idotea baltica]